MTSPKKIIILGGGITGLTAAYRLEQKGISYSLLESSGRLGGKLLTETRAGFTMEMGADAILTRKPWAYALARELGLADRILPINRYPVGTYILHHNRPVPLPDGLQLLVPTKWGPFLRSPLFSPGAKLRVAIEPFVPRRRETTDETLASFIRRRFGQEMLEKVAEPMLGGVFNGESDRQSILATFPQFPAMERGHGSLIRGMKAQSDASRITGIPPVDSRGMPPGISSSSAEENRSEAAPRVSPPPFFSFPKGTQELADSLAACLNGDIRLNTAAVELHRFADGYRVTTSDGESIEAAAVLLATPAPVAADLLQSVAPDAARILTTFRTSSIATAYFAYRRADVPHPLKGYGMVIPRTEGSPIDGMMWTSSKWPGRAPEDHTLIRLFFGGPHTRANFALTDNDALAICRETLRTTLGIIADPLFTHVYRWLDAYPQYDLGHLDRLAAVESHLPSTVVLAGSPYRGIGIPDCINQANEAAAKLAACLG